jgi:hypothetical protein
MKHIASFEGEVKTDRPDIDWDKLPDPPGEDVSKHPRGEDSKTTGGATNEAREDFDQIVQDDDDLGDDEYEADALADPNSPECAPTEADTVIARGWVAKYGPELLVDNLDESEYLPEGDATLAEQERVVWAFGRHAPGTPYTRLCDHILIRSDKYPVFHVRGPAAQVADVSNIIRGAGGVGPVQGYKNDEGRADRFHMFKLRGSGVKRVAFKAWPSEEIYNFKEYVHIDVIGTGHHYIAEQAHDTDCASSSRTPATEFDNLFKWDPAYPHPCDEDPPEIGLAQICGIYENINTHFEAKGYRTNIVFARAALDKAISETNMPDCKVQKKLREKYIYTLKEDRYIDVGTGNVLRDGQVDRSMAPEFKAGVTGKNAAHNEFLNDPDARKVITVTYRPDKPRYLIISEEHNGAQVPVANLYRRSSLAARRGDVTPWLKHLETLFGSPGSPAYEHFLNWLAFVVQNPGKKINHAIVLLGRHGIGKNTAFEPLLRAVGPHNCKAIKPETLTWAIHAFSRSAVDHHRGNDEFRQARGCQQIKGLARQHAIEPGGGEPQEYAAVLRAVYSKLDHHHEPSRRDCPGRNRATLLGPRLRITQAPI